MTLEWEKLPEEEVYNLYRDGNLVGRLKRIQEGSFKGWHFDEIRGSVSHLGGALERAKKAAEMIINRRSA